MAIVGQILFALVAIAAIGFFAWKVGRIRSNILLGKDVEINDRKAERWKKMALVAMGQKKMFKRPIPALLHLAVYLGFIIINIEILEIILDGLLGSHRLLFPLLGGIYPVFISFLEFLALGVLVSCIIFLIRRYGLAIKRFHAREMTAWPRLDATIILISEILLMVFFLTMNGADLTLQRHGVTGYTQTGLFFFSQALMPLLDGLPTGQLIFLERFCWWAHIIGIFAFLCYVPFSKHFHIFISFPNTYYSRLEPQGKMKNMPEIAKEVQLMMNPEAGADAPAPDDHPAFGAKDISQLNWKHLMDAYSCTECGRCTDVCPANITGKKLSPRKIMMDTRDRTEEVGIARNKGIKPGEDGKTLLHDYITQEELLACTNCQACVEACPVSIDPLSIITELRRSLIMEEAKSPNEWNIMFGNIENNGAPWAFPQSDRLKWSEGVMKE
ncbi:MAG: (Fe-S)-binding protein [Bacteroidia bacterium]